MQMLNLNILIFFFFNKCLLLLLLLLSVAVLSCFRPATGAQLPAYECAMRKMKVQPPCSVTHTQLNWTPRKLLLGFG
ncbi:hypothetical protein CK203_094323 [Vitis vinifera]|uniref:Secreted protein n=1 Tax=Vitis vinifera TaxID=29760 RepID=A0A438D2E9_VITVI|nr:hypothetical protein CK203_094323 [Vitis vinifera]